MEKRCPQCQQTKHQSEFNRHRNRTDGLQPICRMCSHDRRTTPRARSQDRARKHTDRYRLQNNAQIAARRAVRSGRIQKPDACQSCGAVSNALQGHHYRGYSYENRLVVRFLCQSCHSKAESVAP